MRADWEFILESFSVLLTAVKFRIKVQLFGNFGLAFKTFSQKIFPRSRGFESRCRLGIFFIAKAPLKTSHTVLDRETKTADTYRNTLCLRFVFFGVFHPILYNFNYFYLLYLFLCNFLNFLNFSFFICDNRK